MSSGDNLLKNRGSTIEYKQLPIYSKLFQNSVKKKYQITFFSKKEEIVNWNKKKVKVKVSNVSRYILSLGTLGK